MPIDPRTAVYDVPAWLSGLSVDLRDARYVSATANAVSIPVAELRGPPDSRGYDPERLHRALLAFAAGTPWDAVPVYREPGERVAVALDGAHRLAVAKAIGLKAIPCRLLTRDEAEGGYCYPEGQR